MRLFLLKLAFVFACLRTKSGRTIEEKSSKIELIELLLVWSRFVSLSVSESFCVCSLVSRSIRRRKKRDEFWSRVELNLILILLPIDWADAKSRQKTRKKNKKILNWKHDINNKRKKKMRLSIERITMFVIFSSIFYIYSNCCCSFDGRIKVRTLKVKLEQSKEKQHW